jgi:hypothetical protein
MICISEFFWILSILQISNHHSEPNSDKSYRFFSVFVVRFLAVLSVAVTGARQTHIEAEFFDVIGTKVLRVFLFLLAIHSHIY